MDFEINAVTYVVRDGQRLCRVQTMTQSQICASMIQVREVMLLSESDHQALQRFNPHQDLSILRTFPIICLSLDKNANIYKLRH